MSQAGVTTIDRRRALLGVIAASVTGLPGCDLARVNNALTIADNQPDGYPTVAGLEYLANRLRQRSQGELWPKVYSGGQLGAESDTLEITILGGIDINRVNIVPLNAFAPATLIPTLPFVFQSVQHMRKSMDGEPGKKILQTLQNHGLVGLCFYDSGARSFYTSQRPIHSPKDMVGLKLRVQNSDLYIDMVKALGADAVPMPYAEVYQGLMQGVVDGAENNWPSYASSRHFEVARFYSLSRHVMAPEVVVMSLRSWEKLSDKHKELVQTCAAESVGVMRNLWDQRVETSVELARAANVEVVEVDRTEFLRLMRPVWGKYLDRHSDIKPIFNDIQSLAIPE